MSEIDPEAVARWRELGLSDAEIGRRLGVSAEVLRELSGVEAPAVDDENPPNTADVR